MEKGQRDRTKFEKRVKNEHVSFHPQIGKGTGPKGKKKPFFVGVENERVSEAVTTGSSTMSKSGMKFCFWHPLSYVTQAYIKATESHIV